MREAGGLRAARPLGLAALLLLTARSAAAAEPNEPDGPTHALGVYTRAGAALALTAARTAGGAGGGIGLRDVLSDWLILQADLSYLIGIGNLGELRAGAGLQLPGAERTYQPAGALLLSLYFGDQLRFLSADHPTPVWDPAVALAVELSPLRFRSSRTRISLLAPAVGMALDIPSVGPVIQVTALEIELLLP